MSDFDLVVIGAGPGGYEAALHAAGLGLHTAIIENREPGGTCLNRGCIPTKTLLHSSELVHEIKNGDHCGVSVPEYSVDLEKIFDRKNAITDQLRNGILTLFQKAKVTYLHGTGTITGEGQVSFQGDDLTRTISCDKILVATGSVPARPPIPGLTLPGVMTSDELLDGTNKLYESIVIIGGGVIGVEFATFYQDLGCNVTIVEGLDRLLPNMDKELGQNLSMILKKRGVEIYTGAMVSDITEAESGLNVNFTCKDKPATAHGEVVLCAIGRKANTTGLLGDGVTLEMNRGSIVVGDNFKTSMNTVYAIGDVSSKIQLAHVATAQGLACVEHMANQEVSVTHTLAPGCIYCRPEIATVGITEADAKDQGINVKTGKCVLFGNAKTVISESDRSFLKVVADASTRKILGAQFMCNHATDMISEITTAIVNGLTVDQMIQVMRPHPTYEEALTDALRSIRF